MWGKLPNVFVKTWECGESVYYKSVLVNDKYRMYKLIYRYSDSYEITRYWNNDKILIDRVKEYCGLKG
uniref:Uncharacterized protein n=1 Tax=Ackermannviridae sp. ctaCq7 TaxID=2827294 RepID=A0A8S5R5C5_9CAUD|nr:MAG TPA: hypothetical protein [Ackermannviridae sp. ctaCq7]